MKCFIAGLLLTTLAIAHEESHQAHVNAKIPQFRSNKLRASDYLQTKPDKTKGKEFFIQSELDEEFGAFNISLTVDLIWVNAVEKPRYATAYP